MSNDAKGATPMPPRLPRAGEECESCREFWVKRNKRPRRLVEIKKRTANHEIPIVICPHCDGTPIIRMNGE